MKIQPRMLRIAPSLIIGLALVFEILGFSLVFTPDWLTGLPFVVCPTATKKFLDLNDDME